MFRFFSRSLLCLVLIMQAAQPSLGCPCHYTAVEFVEQACDYESECGYEVTESVVASSEACDACGCEVCGECGCETKSDETNSHESESTDTKKTESEEAEPTPQPVLSPSTNETTTETVGPAPINVPSDPAAGATDELFPGPTTTDQSPPMTSTPSEAIPTTDSNPPSSTNTEGLFDEPAADPVDSTPEEGSGSSTTTTEELFVEPSTETEETPTASNPLDELFGPSTPAADPAPEADSTDEAEADSAEGEETDAPATDPFDPFSQIEVPAELRAPGGLASREFRGWTDRGSNFQIKARLMRMSAEGVFLADEAGKYVTISFANLSHADLTFVREQVRAQRVVLARQQATLVAGSAN